MECSGPETFCLEGAGRRCHGSGDPGGSEARGTAYRIGLRQAATASVPVGTQRTRGSLRNHASCRRANRRVADDGALARLLLGDARRRGTPAPAGSRAPGSPSGPRARPQRRERVVPRRRSRRPTSGRTRGVDPLVEDGPVDVHADLHGLRVDVRRVAAARAVNGRPVSSTTSSARTIRRPFAGQDRGRRPPGRARRSRSCRAAGPELGQLVLEPAPDARDRCRGTRAGRAPPACRAPSRRPAPAPRRGRGSRSTTARARAWNSATRRRLAHVEHVEQVVRDAAPLGRPAASRCRCPCRGRAASSRC